MAAVQDINRGASGVICDWILASTACVIVILRFWAKGVVMKKLGWDDALMAISLAGAITHAVVITESYQYGFGRHAIFLSDFNRINATKWIFISQGLGVVSPMFGRMAFCIYMLNVVGRSSLWKRNSLIAMIALQVLINVSCVTMIYAQCGSTVAALWGGAEAKCLDPVVQTDYGYFQSAFNSASDLFLTILPAVVIWQLQLRALVKAGLSVLLCLSIFACVASVVKTYEIHILTERGDITWNFVNFVIWAALEIDLVVIVASIPTLRPLFAKRQRAPVTSGYEMYGSKRPTAGSGPSGEISYGHSRRHADSFKAAIGTITTVSQEDILQHQREYGVRTTIDVEVSSTRATDDEAKAMGEVKTSHGW